MSLVFIKLIVYHKHILKRNQLTIAYCYTVASLTFNIGSLKLILLFFESKNKLLLFEH